MPTFTPADADVHSVHGSTFSSFVRTDSGSADLCAWKLDVPPGLTGVAHRPSNEEVILVLAGQLIVTLDGESSTLQTGSVALVPAGSTLRVDTGPVGATAWVTTTAGLHATLPDGSSMAPPWAQ
ncbi:cupin domain-containing protein [Allobranchiibius huperziae]|uniref:Quercetin dioxygenase-like cupin family protein n=1 Tax=Allobranchiibius huperziae TaxID=1874116 RepID=A0A853DGQ1_9MICO|nr:cupin domain-containing protein [Allobranchiibius huperziae]NYJ74031.1 quercetin dioxygenase-like cupin family protein [Allobranchiibius huperziae]